MSDFKFTNAFLAGYGYPIFPLSLDDFRQVVQKHNLVSRGAHELVAKTIPEFVCMDQVTTRDDYRWYCALHFCVDGGRVALLIPWAMDYYAQDGNQNDRSPALYVTGTVNVDAFMEKLIHAFSNFSEKEKISF